MASRSLSESPPQTPWGSGAANAWARQSATTGQPRQMAAAACSRRRCSGPRLPSGWKNSSGLAPRQAPCRCHRHFSVDDPGRPRRSAMGTSRRVVTTVTAPEASETIRRGVRVVDGPDWSSPAGAPVRTRPAALRRGGSPGSQPDPVRPVGSACSAPSPSTSTTSSPNSGPQATGRCASRRRLGDAERAWPPRGSAAFLAPPGFDALPHRPCSDAQGDDGIDPRPAGPGGGDGEADQHRAGLGGADQVLGALRSGGFGVEAGAEAVLSDAEDRHHDHAESGEHDAERSRAGVVTAEEVSDRLDDDVGSEEPEADGDRPLRPTLGGRGERPGAGEAPDDDDAGQSLDGAAPSPADQGD